MRFRFIVCVQLLLFSVLPVWAAAEVYSVAVVPQFSVNIVQRDWAPLLARLEKETGQQFELKFYASIPAFEKGFLAGEPDFAYMNPYHAVMARKAQGYVPLLREGERQLFGILVVRKDSPMRDVQALDGKVVAFPSPNALAASLYMRALLAEKEHVRIVPAYVQTHSNVYRSVALGKAIAGGGVNKTLKKEPKELQEVLREFYRTPGIAPHPICVHPRVPEGLRNRFVAAVLALAASESGKLLLGRISMPNPILADYRKDYGVLEELGLEKYLGGN